MRLVEIVGDEGIVGETEGEDVAMVELEPNKFVVE